VFTVRYDLGLQIKQIWFEIVTIKTVPEVLTVVFILK
jgi:hypothetical protein